MRQVMIVASLALFAGGAAAIACSSESALTNSADGGADGGGTSDQDGGGTTDNGGGSDAGSSGSNTDAGPLGQAGTGAATGLPCDVQATIENRCLACHDGTMKGAGAPPMLNYNDLMVKSSSDPTKSLAQEAAVRMNANGAMQMPPPPAVKCDPSEIADWESWVEAGTPENPMSCTPPAADAGATDGGTTDSGTTTLDAGADGGACTSGKYWTGGNTPDPNMNPGEACMACHQVKGGPNLSFGGTIYTGSHEPDLCYGVAPPPTLTVTVTDRTGRSVSVFATSDGNFQVPVQNPALRAPFKANISDGKKTRSMIGQVTSGDCNSCHTVAGKNGAPGRIMAP
jgi:hypothetical protein